MSMEIPGYKIQKKIGQGGMATVYLAIQESLNRPVVLKIMDTVKTDTDEWKERFISEGRLVASLHHPNIITIFDIGMYEDTLYISMEYVDGGDLKQRMELPIPPAECLDYLKKIGSALSAAHRHGIVHRDVKPGNILFRNDDTPLLTDFGIAKQMDMDMDLTSTGIFLGSPNYVSPEQAEGLAVDGRSDIYSLGCIFYEMLTGEKPFRGESVIDIVIQHKQAPIPQLPEEYAEFQPLLNRMLAKKRDDRFRDCLGMLETIEELQAKLKNQPLVSDFDMTVADTTGSHMIKKKKKKEKEKKLNSTLIASLAIAIAINVGLKVIEMRIKGEPAVQKNITTQSTLLDQTGNHVKANPLPQATDTEAGTEMQTEPASPAVRKALLWLGKQSLEDFRLTYPPKDNAHYYFTKLLEINPQDEAARKGLLKVAERYAILADQAIAQNDYEKSQTYLNIGLQIDPANASLLSLKSLLGELEKQSLWDTLKQVFSMK